MKRTRNLYVFRGLPHGADSRPGRFADLFPDHVPTIVCWGGDARGTPGGITVPLPRPKGRPILMTLSYAMYASFVFWFVLRRVREDDVCVFIDLDSAIFGVFAAKLKRAKCVFDVADPFFMARPTPCPRVVAQIEEAVADRAALVTLPHDVRAQVYPRRLSRSAVAIVENVPAVSPVDRSGAGAPAPAAVESRRPLTLGYFGGLERTHRGLEDLIALARAKSDVNVVLAGRGELQGEIEAAARECDRIRLVGPFSHRDLLDLARGVDVFVGLYYASRELHRFATPNKFYEHLAMGIPFLTSACTPFARDVVETETGWVIEDGLPALQEWANRVERTDVIQRGENSARLWACRYQAYYARKGVELRRALHA